MAANDGALSGCGEGRWEVGLVGGVKMGHLNLFL